MWYGSIFMLALLLSFLGGGSGNATLFAFSAFLFVVAIAVSALEVRGEPIWVAGLSGALIWLGAMGAVSWPLLRWPLVIPGFTVALVYLLVPRK